MCRPFGFEDFGIRRLLSASLRPLRHKSMSHRQTAGTTLSFDVPFVRFLVLFAFFVPSQQPSNTSCTVRILDFEVVCYQDGSEKEPLCRKGHQIYLVHGSFASLVLSAVRSNAFDASVVGMHPSL